MRHDNVILQDIVEHADAVAGFIIGTDKAQFVANNLLRCAVQYNLVIIGEASTQLSKEFKVKHPQIPWKKVAAYRNLVVHGYFTVVWDFVWSTASVDAPAIRLEVSKIISSEFPA